MLQHFNALVDGTSFGPCRFRGMAAEMLPSLSASSSTQRLFFVSFVAVSIVYFS